MAWITFVTRTMPKRADMLKGNIASLESQSDPDYQHLVITDHIGIGVSRANGEMAVRDWSGIDGDYVMVLDDDDVLSGPDVIWNLKHAAPAPVDLIIVRMDHGAWGVLPPLKDFTGPRMGQIGCSAVIPSRDLFMKSVKAYIPRYEGDFYYVKSCYDNAQSLLILDMIATKTTQIGALTKA